MHLATCYNTDLIRFTLGNCQGYDHVVKLQNIQASSILQYEELNLPGSGDPPQWAKRPPLKLEVPGSNPRGWFNGRDGNRDSFRWLEIARGLEPIRLIGRAQCFPGGLAVSSL